MFARLFRTVQHSLHLLKSMEKWNRKENKNKLKLGEGKNIEIKCKLEVYMLVAWTDILYGGEPGEGMRDWHFLISNILLKNNQF